MTNTIKKQITILVELQKIENEINNIKLMIKSVPEKIDGLDKRFKTFEQTIADEELSINEFKKKYRNNEIETDLNLSKIKKNQEKLKFIKNNKEYQALLNEIDQANTKNFAIEDHMLNFLESIDAAKQTIAKQKDEFLKCKEQTSKEKEVFKKKTEQGEKKLIQLDIGRNKITKNLDPVLLKKFILVKQQQYGKNAVVPVKDAVCQGCNMNIPPQLFNELQKCDSLKFCPNCQKIIYWNNLLE